MGGLVTSSTVIVDIEVVEDGVWRPGSWFPDVVLTSRFSLMNRCVLLLQVLLTSDTEEDEEEDEEGGTLPHVHYSGGPLRPSWVAV